MIKTRTYKDNVLAVIHETATGMFDAGVINKRTMRQFDEFCLTPNFPVRPQSKFGPCVNVNTLARLSLPITEYLEGFGQSVGAGQKRPRGTSLKLLSLIERKGTCLHRMRKSLKIFYPSTKVLAYFIFPFVEQFHID